MQTDMAPTNGSERDESTTGRRQHLTTVVLEERAPDEWLATQGGIPVEGRGETAAEAAARYCRKIDEGIHE